jgi:lipopolysaccharide export system protein LptA
MNCAKKNNPLLSFITIIGLICLLIKFGLTVTRDNSRQQIILEHADTLRSRNDSRYLIGNVQVRRGLTQINSDRARHDPKNGQITLTGNVVLIEPGRVMNADYVNFNEFNGSFEARENVDLIEADSVRIRCNVALYDDANQIIDLYGNVIIDNYSDGARITGKHCRWYEASNSGIIDQDPVYRLPDDKGTQPDTLVIKSKILQFNRVTNSALFTGNVDLVQNQLHALSDTLNHMPDSNMTVLMGNPVIHHDKDELSGKKVELFYEGQKLIRMYVDGDALVISIPEEDSTLFNYMIGKEMTMTVINDSTRLIQMEGNAQGVVHVWDGEGLYHGVNQSAADKIELTMISDKTESIILKGRSNGIFYPPKDIPDDLGEDNAVLLSRKSKSSP